MGSIFYLTSTDPFIVLIISGCCRVFESLSRNWQRQTIVIVVIRNCVCELENCSVRIYEAHVGLLKYLNSDDSYERTRCYSPVVPLPSLSIRVSLLDSTIRIIYALTNFIFDSVFVLKNSYVVCVIFRYWLW